jgi:hypothetical protein
MNGIVSIRHLCLPCLIAGLLLMASCALYGIHVPALFFGGYLSAFLFWSGISLGCLGLLLIQYLTGGLWGMVITRLLEAGMMTLPLCAILFLPILAGMPCLFPWLHPHGEEMRHLVREKAAFLNVPFYVGRYFLYFLILGAVAFWLRRLSLRRDAGDLIALRKWSGPSLIAFVLLMNFACIDWVMSLNPEWYSSMLVVEFVTEQGVAALAWCLVVLRCLSHLPSLHRVLTVKVVHDLGNLLLALTCFWTYVTFSEYLIIWTGNLPHEVVWFSDRSSQGWKIFATLLVIAHFVIPLFCLILTKISQNLVRLARVAAWVLLAHFLQVIWWTEPAFGRQFQGELMSILLMIAVGAIWVASYTHNLGAAPLLLKEVLPQEEEVSV